MEIVITEMEGGETKGEMTEGRKEIEAHLAGLMHLM
jgi:hypothetical protein